MPHEAISADGSFSFESGVNSQAVTTIQSALTATGLKRSELAWLTNATVRGGGITQRTGWQPNCRVSDGRTFVQGGITYQPINGGNPWFIFLIGGHVWKIVPDTGAATDLSAKYGVFLPALTVPAFFVQAEEFVVIQVGDGVTLPLFYDGEPPGGFGLRASIGIVTPTPLNQSGQNEIPAATAMVYYMERIWYAQGHTVSAGDIVKGPSGNGPTYPKVGGVFVAPYFGRFAILNVTENPLCFGGDGFTVPDDGGNIRALFYPANLNTALGQGLLYIGTRKAVYSLQVPVTRADWIGANTSNAPQRQVVQRVNGPVNDRSVVHVNGDVFYQALEPSVRSLFQSIRNDNYWGNKAISRNVDRAMRFNDRSLMIWSSGIEFDNRLLMAILPKTLPSGQVVHQGILPLDFDIISTLDASQDLPPAWEGLWQGVQIIQLFTGDFSGVQRAFALAVDDIDGSIVLWDLTKDQRFQNGDNRVIWVIETPAFTWGKEFELKQLRAIEIYVDKEFGTVEMLVNYREDANNCWREWGRTQFCAARSCAEDLSNPACYPIAPTYREGYVFPVTFGEPPAVCGADSLNKRPSNQGHQFQIQIAIKGWCRVRGILPYSSPIQENIFERLTPCLEGGSI